MTGQLLFDVSTSLNWSGPPAGIVRVEQELVKWLASNASDYRLVSFDTKLDQYCEISYAGFRASLEGDVVLDFTDMKDVARPRFADRIPAGFRGLYFWTTRFRRMALRKLGELVLDGRSTELNSVARYMMRLIGGKKYGRILGWSENPRRVLARPGFPRFRRVKISAGDRLVLSGANWNHGNIEYIARQKSVHEFKLIVLCHDIIPLVHPQFYNDDDVHRFRCYFDIAFSISSLVLITSKNVGRDILSYCKHHSIPIPEMCQIPLGSTLPQASTLPQKSAQPIVGGRYIIFVSTIEPRKGHRMIQHVWKTLVDQGLPHTLDVTLLLVGRPGWLVDDLLPSLAACERLVILDGVDDDKLANLLDGADFSIYPSEYEGYGLPVVEALSRQRPVIASNVGIVPELHSPLLRRLPVGDQDAWLNAIRDWMLSPPDTRGAQVFRAPSWHEAASVVFARINNSSE